MAKAMLLAAIYSQPLKHRALDEMCVWFLFSVKPRILFYVINYVYECVSRHSTHRKRYCVWVEVLHFLCALDGMWNWRMKESAIQQVAKKTSLRGENEEHCSVRVFSLHCYINSILRLKWTVTPTQFTKFLVAWSLYHSLLRCYCCCVLLFCVLVRAFLKE